MFLKSHIPKLKISEINTFSVEMTLETQKLVEPQTALNVVRFTYIGTALLKSQLFLGNLKSVD